MAARLYSLFRKDGKRWVRVQGAGAYHRATAVRVFQNQLINSAFTDQPCSIRPIPAEKQKVPSVLPAQHVLCGPCLRHAHSGCERGDCACGCRMYNR